MRFMDYTLLLSLIFPFAFCFADVGGVIAMKSLLIKKLNFRSAMALHDVIAPSFELALSNCQTSFKWDRWNCPSSDFLSKRTSSHLDRESAYVVTITTAALIYTVTKKCSSGALDDCGCTKDEHSPAEVCSDDPAYAERLTNTIFQSHEKSTSDVYTFAMLHNNRLAKLIIRRSLRRFCHCENEDVACGVSKCWHTLRPFVEIADEIRASHDKAMIVKVDNSGQIEWQHIPDDVLLYVEDSPNYCVADAIVGWSGMRGRQCSRRKGKEISQRERQSCRNLCRACGLRTRGHTMMGRKRCNCRFSWCCEVKCDVCVSVEKQRYCD